MNHCTTLVSLLVVEVEMGVEVQVLVEKDCLDRVESGRRYLGVIFGSLVSLVDTHWVYNCLKSTVLLMHYTASSTLAVVVEMGEIPLLH